MPIRINIQAETDSLRSFESLAEFLRSFADLYKAAVILSNPKYADLRNAGSLDAVRLEEEDRLGVEKLTVGSLKAILVAATEALSAVQAVIIILGWRIDRRLKREMLEKTSRENAAAREAETNRTVEELRRRAAGAPSGGTTWDIARRIRAIGESEVRVREVGLESVRPDMTPRQYLEHKQAEAKHSSEVRRARRTRRAQDVIKRIPLLPDHYDEAALDQVKRFLAQHEGDGTLPPPVVNALREYIARWESRQHG